MQQQVGLIGVGAMGSALLERLRGHEHAVMAYEIAEARLDAARCGGATIAQSPAMVARQSRLIHVFVNTDAQVLDVTLGKEGLFAGAAPGTLVLLNSTILPATTLRIAAAGDKIGVSVVDAPITAVPRRIRAGDGIILLGGGAGPAERARTHLVSLGFDVRHFGPLGAGNAAKLAKNFANAAERLVLTAAVELAEASGLDPRLFLEMMQAADSGALISRWEHVFDVDGSHAIARAVTNLYNKDLGLAAELAKDRGLDSPVIDGAAEAARRAVAGWAKPPGKGIGH